MKVDYNLDLRIQLLIRLGEIVVSLGMRLLAVRTPISRIWSQEALRMSPTALGRLGVRINK